MKTLLNLPQTTVTVNGAEYRLTALPSVKGRAALQRLTHILAPSLQGAFAAGATGPAVLSAILELAASLSTEDFDYFYRLYEPNTEVMAAEDFVPVAMGGQPWIQDYGTMLEVMVEHCKFNFGSFFAFALRQLLTARSSASPSPST